MAKDLAKGTTCKCGKFEPFHPWVYAHWDEELVRVCECGVKTTVLAGRVLRQTGKPKCICATKKGCSLHGHNDR